MPELLLLSFSRSEFRRLHRLAMKGDEDAIQQIESVWDEHRDREIEIECFLCQAVIIEPRPFCMVLPDPSADHELIGAPLCSICRDLPTLVRWHRCLKLVSKMGKARSGRQLHYNIVGSRR